MGDLSDYWREAREYKRDLRSNWHECPHCAERYGTGTLTPPGCNCRNCGWEAPGVRGSDRKAARRAERDRFHRERADQARRDKSGADRTCRFCGKVLGSRLDEEQHEQSVHAKRIAKEAAQ